MLVLLVRDTPASPVRYRLTVPRRAALDVAADYSFFGFHVTIT